jgi:Fic family protein
MAGIAEEEPGLYRTTDAALFRGNRIIKMAPPPEKVSRMMDDLFELLNSKEENILIKSCMAHYTMERIQPFKEASGIMGRLWQTLILFQEYGIFEFLPWEIQVYLTREDYYRTLANSEEAGQPADFIHYMLGVINDSLETVPDTRHRSLSASDRLLFFHELGIQSFTRKNYMKVFTNISSATASRDLIKGVDAGLFERKGTKNASLYSCQ